MDKLLPLVFVALYVLFHVVERLFPGRPQPKVAHWTLQGVLAFALAGVLNAVVPAAIQRAGGDHQLLDASALPLPLAVVAIVLVRHAVMYWVHRARHQSDLLWRVHQMHHSAERQDMAGAFFFHPVDMAIAVAVGASISAFLLRATPDAAAIAGAIGFVTTCFTHLNVRTPRWLGYVVARPESHSLHHERGVHAFNYGDLPYMDMLFGTFRNPKTFAEQIGFYDGASAQTLHLLLGCDVTSDDASARAAGDLPSAS